MKVNHKDILAMIENVKASHNKIIKSENGGCYIFLGIGGMKKLLWHEIKDTEYILIRYMYRPKISNFTTTCWFTETMKPITDDILDTLFNGKYIGNVIKTYRKPSTSEYKITFETT